MLKSRRGLLAAGLTVAVIGAIGVASTLNAGAEQISGEAAPAAAAAPADALTPPSSLPWGAKPQRVKRGRDGATSRSLKTAGLSVAAPEAGADTPEPEYAPKGRTAKSTFLKTAKTNVVPPEPSASATAQPEASSATAAPTVNFHYNVGSQAAVTDGVYANLTINKPVLAKDDYHTLAEIAVQSADGKQIVEVGWNVDRVVNGDDDPHLFVYHWVNRETSCYNGCGFLQYSKTAIAGDTLPLDTSKRFGIQYFNNAWWIAYDTEWVGYFPVKLWGDVDFSKSGLIQVFGEVAASSDKPCTQMGNGKSSTEGTAARIGSLAYLNGPPVDMFVRSTSDYYNVTALSNRTFRYGGPGAC
ncbi:neprosin family prolyl endopeptidase [Actinoplanes oblitus]|uniref:Neprosin family prolyl endopeptidase n=1 Tax=Actinoplanes oblitus TaxID=3040509 RepID=A0ABY8WIH2_9ACTN|nr:neprosin family prolyl endopeptidase [Actinoplanes oblitus]WIM96888.1 neprosin family prolyl endopeptidase [Actinoplanes oblitus]